MKRFIIFALVFTCIFGLFGCKSNDKIAVRSSVSETKFVVLETEQSSPEYQQAASAPKQCFETSSSAKNTASAQSDTTAVKKESAPLAFLSFPNDADWFTPQSNYCIQNQVYSLNGYSNSDSKIVKIDLSTQNVRVLTDSRPASMLVYQDYIYYTKMNAHTDSESIWRMSLEGFEKESLTSENCHSFSIYKNKIYYVSSAGSGDAGFLYRMDLNGQNKQKLCSSNEYTTISDNRIYYRNNGKVYSVSVDGSDESFCDNNNDTYIQYIDTDVLYSFNDRPQGMVLRRKQFKTGETETLCTVNGAAFSLNGSWIYYIDIETGLLHRSKANGSDKQAILPVAVHSYSLQDGFLYAWGMPCGGKTVFYQKDLRTGAIKEFLFENSSGLPVNSADQKPDDGSSGWEKPYDPKQMIADCQAYIQKKKCIWAEEVHPSYIKASKCFNTNMAVRHKSLKEQVLEYITTHMLSGNSRFYHVSIEPAPDNHGEYKITVWVLHQK